MVRAIISNCAARERALSGLLAGSGRIGEALGLEIGKHVSPDCRSLDVRQSVWHSTVQAPKTRNALRRIHFCSELASLLKAFIGDLADDAPYFLSHASAMELHRMVTQPQFVIFVSSTKRIPKQTLHGAQFRFVLLKSKNFFGNTKHGPQNNSRSKSATSNGPSSTASATPNIAAG